MAKVLWCRTPTIRRAPARGRPHKRGRKPFYRPSTGFQGAVSPLAGCSRSFLFPPRRLRREWKRKECCPNPDKCPNDDNCPNCPKKGQGERGEGRDIQALSSLHRYLSGPATCERTVSNPTKRGADTSNSISTVGAADGVMIAEGPFQMLVNIGRVHHTG